jgi:hypothetical protein
VYVLRTGTLDDILLTAAVNDALLSKPSFAEVWHRDMSF